MFATSTDVIGIWHDRHKLGFPNFLCADDIEFAVNEHYTQGGRHNERSGGFGWAGRSQLLDEFPSFVQHESFDDGAT